MSDEISRIESPDAPNRCQAVTAKGQCLNKAVPNGTRCLAHGGNLEQQAEKRESLRNYRLSKWHAKLERHAESPGIKSLRDEIGILRLLLEERLNLCHDSNDLILQSHTISDLVTKIERVVASCHKLEGSMGQLLDKQAILQFSSEVVGIISDELDGDEDKIDTIATRILELVGRIGDGES